jgi:magnesium transporter
MIEIWSCVDGRWHAGDSEFATARWFHLTGHDELEGLARRFDLHPLAVEDCISEVFHMPKVEEFEGHIFVVLAALVAAEPEPLLTELNVFLGRDFLITHTGTPIPEAEQALEALRHGRLIRPGVDGLFYEVADRIVDGIMPEVDGFADQLDILERRVLAGEAGSRTSADVVTVRAHAGQVRRVLASQLAVMQRLSRGEFVEIGEANRPYFRDVYDHMIRVDLALEAVREDAELVLSTYMSSLNNHMNEVMKVLSVVAALALPATVISGIFGTNFDNVPGLHSNWGFAGMLILMLGVAGGMAYYFRRRHWF